ncbi:MAG: SpoIID/LytB domain-containing protein [Lachnospiraceae bacterium]|nr:SpoIID/LytB domain-containing protein [Lachnospiraceae bacterium]
MLKNKQKIIHIMLAVIMCISMLQGICIHAEQTPIPTLEPSVPAQKIPIPPKKTPIPPKKKYISMKKALTLEVGKTETLTVSGTKKAVKWSSSNKKVAVLTKVGKKKLKILGKDNGTTTITAKAENQRITCKVKVEKKQIHILLKSTGYSSLTHDKVTLTSTNKFTISNGKKAKTYPAKKVVTIKASSKIFKGASAVTIQAEKKGRITLNSIKRSQGNPSYRGAIILRKSGKNLSVVNEVPLEEYLYSVVSSEISTSSSAEALKAQAITARSYAYSHLGNGNYKKYKADFDDSANFQVYNNIAETRSTRKAVNETEHKVLKDGNKIISTFYFSTSFGQTTLPSEIWGSVHADKYYKSILQQKRETQKNLSKESTFIDFMKSSTTTFDSKSDWYRWHVTIPKKDFQKYINKKLASWYASYPSYVKTKQKNGSYKSQKISTIGKLKNVTIVDRKKSGLACALQITGSKNTVRIYGTERLRYILLPDSNPVVKKNGGYINMSSLPSSFFYVKKGKKNYTIHGGGYGHGVGMSQSGANQMGREGYSCSNILHHYFKNVQIKRIVN